MATQPLTSEVVVAADAPAPTTLLDAVVDQTVIDHEARKFEHALKFGEAAARSQYFPETTSVSQAAMKIMAGDELGLAPIASLMSVDIIKGRVSFAGGLVGTMLRRHGYSWKFGQHDENGCTIFCYYKGNPILNEDGSRATVTFNRADAERAGLTEKQGEKKDKSSMYDKYGPDMYFNRCIVRFQRRFAPEVTRGVPVITPDEAEEMLLNDAADAATNAEPQMPRRKEAE